tara:strand:- start:912 stop:1145 length:234 start_codon:yes stop_codon:yes gene_type:complete
MANYENREQLKKHLSNAIGYMKHDRTQFSLPTTVAFLEGYLDGLEEEERKLENTLQFMDNKNKFFDFADSEKPTKVT